MTLAATWPGPHPGEARAAFERARQNGMSAGRSLVLGIVASFKQGWIFRRTIAKHTGLCVRTVQRALTQGRELGLIGTARAKPTEIPPGLTAPVKCGWSHRWVVGWGLAVQAAKEAVEKARLRRMVKTTAQASSLVKAQKHAFARPVARTWTAEQIDAELERLTKVPQGPP